ncbi:MAG: winged helix-turn-helix domain-containing protein [Dehalococcoidia bacterium]|nr:winged helix-turn-helix domain-containing protein [Dehalococcoidia bacterium]
MNGGNGRRNDIRIVMEILRLAQNQSGQTRIIYGSNLNYKRAKYYLETLERRGYLESKRRDRRISYRITQRGRQALTCIERVLQLLDGQAAPPPAGARQSGG